MRCSFAMLAIGSLMVAACGGATTAGGSTEGRRIEIAMKEFAFTPTSLTLKPGEKVTLVFKQAGTIEHEFMAGTKPVRDMGYEDDLFAGVDHEISPKPVSDHGMGHSAAKVGVRVQPGKAATMSFVVPSKPGAYEFGCFVAGHYESGMKGTLTIQ